MATIGYVLLSSNRDSVLLQVRDIGKPDHWFLRASLQIVSRPLPGLTWKTERLFPSQMSRSFREGSTMPNLE